MQLYFLPYLAAITIGYSVISRCEFFRGFVFLDFLFSVFFVFWHFVFSLLLQVDLILELLPFYLSAFISVGFLVLMRALIYVLFF